MTVDVEPPGLKEDAGDRWGPEYWEACFREEADEYIDPSLDTDDFSRSKLPTITVGIRQNAICNGTTSRDERSLPLFSFLYADGHKMLSIGGMPGQQPEEDKLHGIDGTLPFVRRTLSDPCEIRVPLITRRERLFLDSHMPCSDDWVPTEFELPSQTVRDYKEVCRYYPAYVEMLL